MAVDMTGQKIHFLTVLQKVKNPKGYKNGSRWLCECECGNQKIIHRRDLMSGRVYSCGCYNVQKNKEIHKYENLLNQTFGYLTVIEDTYDRSVNRHHLWKCRCKCGNNCIVTSDRLKSGNTTSCGCIKSKGEQQISNLLRQLNIPFEMQKTFDTCRFPDTNALAKFDFYVDNTYIIEYDGIQHFEPTGGWNQQSSFDKTKQHDLFKNNWCKENNIPIIRIPYTKINNISKNDILLKEIEI